MLNGNEVLRLKHCYEYFENSAILKIQVRTLQRGRLEGIGPKYLKLGGAVRYSKQDLQDWLAVRPSDGGIR
jgi:hypothetical protein